MAYAKLRASARSDVFACQALRVRNSSPRPHLNPLLAAVYLTVFSPHRVCRLFTHLRAYSNHACSISASSGRPTGAKIGSAAPLRHNKTGLRTFRFSEKTKKDALRLVQSGINPFIISTFSQNSRRENVQFEGKIDPFRHEIGLFRAFSGSL